MTKPIIEQRELTYGERASLRLLEAAAQLRRSRCITEESLARITRRTKLQLKESAPDDRD